MTITPLPAGPARSRPPHLRYGKQLRRPVAAVPADVESLTVTFEVTLTGDERYLDTVEVLDALRRVTQRLANARVGVRPPLASAEHPSTVDSYDGSESDRVQVLVASREVRQGGQPIPFTRLEFDLLHFLARHPRQVFNREQLLERVWGFGHAGHRTVDVHIRRLRAKLAEGPIVTTVRGVGYRLSDDAAVDVIAHG